MTDPEGGKGEKEKGGREEEEGRRGGKGRESRVGRTSRGYLWLRRLLLWNSTYILSEEWREVSAQTQGSQARDSMVRISTWQRAPFCSEGGDSHTQPCELPSGTETTHLPSSQPMFPVLTSHFSHVRRNCWGSSSCHDSPLSGDLGVVLAPPGNAILTPK